VWSKPVGSKTAGSRETIDTAFDYSDRCCGGQCRTLRKNPINYWKNTPHL